VKALVIVLGTGTGDGYRYLGYGTVIYLAVKNSGDWI
jgi:hypothetical protein